MPPEYLMHGQFSIKSDVYSFGVLVLEIISERPNNGFRSGESVEDLLSFVSANYISIIFLSSLFRALMLKYEEYIHVLGMEKLARGESCKCSGSIPEFDERSVEVHPYRLAVRSGRCGGPNDDGVRGSDAR